MRFVTIDTETTSVDRKTGQIIEIALVAVDTMKPRRDWPVYHKAVAHDEYVGSAYAINLNARLFAILRDWSLPSGTAHDVVHVDNLGLDIFNFLTNECGYAVNGRGRVTIYVAGKNPHGFDIAMMMNDQHDIRNFVDFGHRSLDPGILFLDHEADSVPPGLELCKERAGLGNIVTHNAKEDAFDVINLIFAGLEIPEVE